jgi:hypothetical protein
VTAALPRVAPHDACIACLAGDTATGVALIGGAEFVTAALVVWGLPDDQAAAMVRQYGSDDDGPVCFTVCAGCAARAHMTVAPFSGGNVPVYRERDLEATGGERGRSTA